MADYRRHIVESKEFVQFDRNYHASVDLTRDTFSRLLSSDGKVDSGELLQEVDDCLGNCSRVFGNLIMMLQSMDGLDEPMYAHCVNVSLLAAMLGMKLKFSDQEIQILLAGGLFHDIGKLRIPERIIHKPGELSEEEFHIVKRHPMEGYKLLRNKGFSEDVLMCVLQHHERCDGTGYPYGVKRDQINKYARLIAIADVFEELTTNRVYRSALSPFAAMRVLEEERYEKYEMEYLLTFLEYIVEVYVGMDVNLSNGETGKIILPNQQDLSRPLIQTKDGFIDLARESKDVTIKEIL
jgi:putative nucleotidyltransferase with HDIG domain